MDCSLPKKTPVQEYSERRFEVNMEDGLFECRVAILDRAPGCTGLGFKVGKDKGVCSVCQDWIKQGRVVE